MRKRRAVLLAVLIVLVAITVVYALDVYTDYLNLGLGDRVEDLFGNIDLGDLNIEGQIAGLTFTTIIALLDIVAAAVLATVYYHHRS